MPLSETSRRAIYARDGGGEVVVGLLTITHAELGTPLRFASTYDDFTSRGHVHDGAPFSAEIPPQFEGSEQSVTIIVENVDRAIEATLAVLTREPTFTYEVVLASAPDTVIMGPYVMPLRSSETSRDQIRLTLGAVDPILSRIWPSARFSQADFPGLEAL